MPATRATLRKSVSLHEMKLSEVFYAYIDSLFTPISCIKCRNVINPAFFLKFAEKWKGCRVATLKSCNPATPQPNACPPSGKSGLDTREAGKHTHSTYITPFSFRCAIQVSPLRIAQHPCSIVILSSLFVNGIPGGMSIGLPAATGSLSSRSRIA